ncbi:hypothetical protein RSal33209_3158 [Renibacterium salmoninarum ATCC 33209]|uniref:Uncharacterized protein n=1 Tax=Renibacterium salmoninarum (strain ATCC 33209 / DSM 20767 / JCM 11484 / NBRC 15589 / NCIMB 2235) TaxID=288705 RepID=A9WUK5_RENSM|nr:hypothetical protein RSal33209_3158 [Renibacterium salmoninarum ATCC 33209]
MQLTGQAEMQEASLQQFCVIANGVGAQIKFARL